MLSDRHRAVFDFIVRYKKENDGNSPSITEIGAKFKINSKSHVMYILSRLHNYGLIRLESKAHRSIQVIGGKWIYEGNNQLSSTNSSKSVS